ncbi:MAG: alpha/beta hydrolase [Saprospiraceae bacterium]
MLKKIGFFILVLLGLLLLGYFLGPKAPVPQLAAKLPTVPSDLVALEAQINQSELQFSNIRPDNQARIEWYNPQQKEKTAYSIVYLHGFSASLGEGDPVHRDFAQRYGCNLYLSRLAEHGISQKDAMLKLTPENMLQSAKEAIAIGKQIGERVIVMSCSTGGTLGLYLAAAHPELEALICYSPNIDLYDPASALLTGPWGKEILSYMMGSEYYQVKHLPPGSEQYITSQYRIEAIVALKSLINATMTEATFRKIKQPLFLGYYYKNEEEQDKVVSIPRMLEMFEQVSTPANLKVKHAFGNAGNHVLPSPVWSNDIAGVKAKTFEFAENVLDLKPVLIPARLELEE